MGPVDKTRGRRMAKKKPRKLLRRPRVRRRNPGKGGGAPRGVSYPHLDVYRRRGVHRGHASVCQQDLCVQPDTVDTGNTVVDGNGLVSAV